MKIENANQLTTVLISDYQQTKAKLNDLKKFIGDLPLYPNAVIKYQDSTGGFISCDELTHKVVSDTVDILLSYYERRLQYFEQELHKL